MTVFQMLNNSRALDRGEQHCQWWQGRESIELDAWWPTVNYGFEVDIDEEYTTL